MSRFTKMFRGGGTWAKLGGGSLGGPLGYTTMQNGGLGGWMDDTSGSAVHRLTAPLNELFNETGVNDIKSFAERGYGALAPYVAGGISALGEMLRLEKDPSSIANTGQYKFRLDQGLDAITRRASAAGFSGSGNVLFEMMNYGQGLASTEYDNRWKQLLGLVDVGNRAAGSTATLSADTGRTISQHNTAMTGHALTHRNQMTDELYTWLGMGSGGGMGGGSMMSMFCWVAMELYGTDHIRTLIIRSYVTEHEKDKSLLGWFCRFYRKHGQQWSVYIKTHKIARKITKLLFDGVYKLAVRD